MIMWLKKYLRRICKACLNRLEAGDATIVGSAEPVDEPRPGRAYRIPSEEEADPLRRAYSNFFGPRRAEDQEVHFRPVGIDGIFVARTAEWFREGNTLRGRVVKIEVLTCSGQIVPPESLKAVCFTCLGYEAVLIRCSTCSKTLCHLHAYPFVLPDRTVAMFCEGHRKEAEQNYDSWASQDHAREQARRARE